MVKSYTEAALRKLRSSDVDAPAAQYAGITELPPDTTAALYPSAPRAPALRLPYYNVHGKPTPLYRLRLLAPPTGWRGSKYQRYYQPPGTLPQVYFPRVRGMNWQSIISTPEERLIITEGELKALCGTLHELNVIGLGGVWNWRSAKNNVALIDDLKHIRWKNREVYIAYDSDAAAKPDVVDALLALAEALGALGAVVYDATIDEVPGFEKTGLDDYLVAKGEKALIENVLRRAEPVVANHALHSFNKRYLYVANIDRVMEVASGALLDTYKFIHHIAANETYTVSVNLGNNQTKLMVKQTAKEWIAWRNRAEVRKLAFVPGGESILPGPAFNTWRGLAVQPQRGDVTPWRKLLDHMFANAEPHARTWFERWAAYPLQRLGAKLYTAVAVWGHATGTGKTLMGETLKLLYGENGQLISNADLEDTYNDWIVSKQFILGDEVTGNESRKHADKLKGFITSNTIAVRMKYQPLYELANCANFYFTSNHPDAFFIDPWDRRFFVIEAPRDPLPQSFYDTYDAWMRSPLGLGALLHHLLNLDLADFQPRMRAPQTEAKQRMIEDSRSDLSLWIDTLLNEPEQVIPKINGHEPREIFSSAELAKFYDPGGTKGISICAVGRELKRQGARLVLRGLPVRAEGLPQSRYFAVFNVDRWVRAGSQLVRDHLEKHKFGKGKEKF